MLGRYNGCRNTQESGWTTAVCTSLHTAGVQSSADTFEIYIKNYFMGIRVPETAKDIKTGKLAKTGEMVLPTMGYARNIKASLFRLFTKEYKVRN